MSSSWYLLTFEEKAPCKRIGSGVGKKKKKRVPVPLHLLLGVCTFTFLSSYSTSNTPSVVLTCTPSRPMSALLRLIGALPFFFILLFCAPLTLAGTTPPLTTTIYPSASPFCGARTCTANIKNGNWTDPSIWSCSCVGSALPGETDFVSRVTRFCCPVERIQLWPAVCWRWSVIEIVTRSLLLCCRIVSVQASLQIHSHDTSWWIFFFFFFFLQVKISADVLIPSRLNITVASVTISQFSTLRVYASRVR